MALDKGALRAQLIVDEGSRLKPYTDTVGKLSIGVGRNLTDVGISNDERDLMLDNDIARTIAWLDANLPWWKNLDDVRQGVIANMAFNLRGRLLGFVSALAAMQVQNWQAAHDQMLDSVWARQVGARAQRLATQMLTGSAS